MRVLMNAKTYAFPFSHSTPLLLAKDVQNLRLEINNQPPAPLFLYFPRRLALDVDRLKKDRMAIAMTGSPKSSFQWVKLRIGKH